MSNKNKLIGLSLIALATLCACNDDNHADGKGNRLVTFSVNAKANGGWSDINGSRSAWMSPQAQQMGEPVEMEGKLNGNSVYLTSEVTEGFPTDNPTFTRGTQITNADGMSSFGVTAFMGSQKYMDHVEIKKSGDSWKPQTDYFWLNGKSLDFYAWYPYNSAEGTNGIPAGMILNQEDFSSISYTVPTDVSKQEDLMFAVNKNASEPADGNATSLDFKHSLAAVKFVLGDLPTGTKVTSVALKGVKYKGDLAVTAGNNGAAQLAWSNLANETRDFTQATNKEVKENDTDNAITKEDQTFFMMPQTLPDDAIVEVVVEDEKGAKVTLTGALQDATAAGGPKNKWEAGNTYTYSISLSGIIQAEVTFFKGINGLNGQPYTSHNISANGDPFNLTLKYPDTVEKITARIAYETKETSPDGSTTYKYEEIKQYENLIGKNEHNFTSPCMNNKGDETHAKENATPFVVQIKIKASAPLRMPTDPDRPGEYKYHPGSDDETWFTIWRGTMFPPNYVLQYPYCSVYVGRKNLTYNGSVTSTVFNMRASSLQYFEVDENHPKLGKGKFDFNNITDIFSYNTDTFQKVSWAIACWIRDNQAPSNKAIYGEKFINYHYWSYGCNGGTIYWIFNYKFSITSPWNWYTVEHNYSGYDQYRATNSQMCSVNGTAVDLCARGFAVYW